ncbi:zinc finger protein 593 isoform X1 [Medicago truncatula]|uniref:zinc finger protein 593 isoform X1 n=1 Tax=Medicago truncatula TaxID=3880 RepID=UPI0019682FA8|nr:zinc finger protein 593 isoform X1 [Medicago truncatula]
MGGKCPHRKVKKRRLSHKTDRRSKFLIKGDDMVYDELNKPQEDRKPLPLDEDLPGMGQHYCLHCDRFFASVAVRDEHFKTKKHRRREKTCRCCSMKSISDGGESAQKSVKQMMGDAPHTQLDADLAGGMGMPDNGPKLMSM